MIDLSVFKDLPISSDRRRLQLRAEIFNLSNRPQFNIPNAGIGDPGAGRISSAGEPFFFQRTSRQIQLAVKFYF